MQENELRLRITGKVLARIRRERGEPNWRPTGMLNGGIEMTVKARMRLKRLQARFQREGARRGEIP